MTNESELLAIHATDPLAARWFSLAQHCLRDGYTVTRYTANEFKASMPEARFDCEMQADGSVAWGWDWSEDGDSGEDHGVSEAADMVLVDWYRVRNPD